MSALPRVRLKHLVRLVNDKSKGQMPYVGLEHVSSWTGRYTGSDDPAAFDDAGARHFRAGDVLFGKLRPYLAKAVLAQESGSCSSEFLILRPKRIMARFLNYSLLTPDVIERVTGSTFGAKMPRANWDFIGTVAIPVPPLPTQRAVANFLDRRTAAIDTLIEKKQEILDRLDEKRAALINQAVTKGLDPSVPMKDSGIPPLGDVPAHWDVVRNKVLVTEVADLSTTGEEELLTVSHLTGVTPRSEKDVTMFMAETLVGYKRVRPGDLVINTMWAWMGALGTASTDGIVSPAYGVYRLQADRMLPEFFDMFYRTPQYVCEMTRYSRGVWSSRLRLYPESFLGLQVPVPPLDEQEEIVRHVRGAVGTHPRLRDMLAASVDRLKEYRQALITAAVTGQLDIEEGA